MDTDEIEAGQVLIVSGIQPARACPTRKRDNGDAEMGSPEVVTEGKTFLKSRSVTRVSDRRVSNGEFRGSTRYMCPEDVYEHDHDLLVQALTIAAGNRDTAADAVQEAFVLSGIRPCGMLQLDLTSTNCIGGCQVSSPLCAIFTSSTPLSALRSPARSVAAFIPSMVTCIDSAPWVMKSATMSA